MRQSGAAHSRRHRLHRHRPNEHIRLNVPEHPADDISFALANLMPDHRATRFSVGDGVIGRIVVGDIYDPAR